MIKRADKDDVDALTELAIRMWKEFVDECHRLTDDWRKHVDPCLLFD